jgi:hypothetical protein
MSLQKWLEYVGGVSGEDVDELIAFVNELPEKVILWLNKQHPDLLSGEK